MSIIEMMRNIFGCVLNYSNEKFDMFFYKFIRYQWLDDNEMVDVGCDNLM